MIHSFTRLLEIIAVLGSVSSCFYYVFALWSAAAFLRQSRVAARPGADRDLPAISILKPLKGVDPEIYESFRSHCLQDYPEYEIIFGVSEANDPAADAVKRLQKEFPGRKIELLVCSQTLGANVKISNLEQMLSMARYEHLLLNDSDIRVAPDYLCRIVAPLCEQAIGLVTCLYRGVASPTLGSRLESLGISTDFSAGVLVAREMEGGLRFGLGSTLAFRRKDLERIGSFKSMVDFLADDYELGRRIAGLGLQVCLPDVVVDTHLPQYDLKGYFSHQLRWARGIRDSRPGGYVGMVATFGLMWGLLAVAAAPESTWSWILMAVVAALRLAVAIVVGKTVLQDRQLQRDFWLIPVRDLLAVAVWIASFAGHTVTWRGDRFELKSGRLIRIAE